ncbi:uncharacterized protein MONOS_8426 [Monocercomonoides exilis]|uniref:uncharacterized protein n=1 Tax=Monocercomonoides exilis TaxID=2049356 RepID=UPI00355A24B4|nr:hypothetical protein MONOS_8426 [Monocercomonoides exilis]|eukprot:MONOS_8426.1-p1 / transcript=MONOS_8426.1 / gene=MONOS_8426 / organism=Monocercomonoides_exilis_PA203 / gene_product=unspecified product / transcript_product=unspecified product / location=Mono_scaffold00317:20055-20759(+) / protein_length=215 / sequence_SO=supercontig / SO=protein_coding / is_pseudo=false
MWGAATDSFVEEEDLLLRVLKYQSETIFVSSIADNHTDSEQCGGFEAPCESLSEGVRHIFPSSYSQLLIAKDTIINGECEAKDASIHSLESPSTALVHLDSTITNDGSLIITSENVRIETNGQLSLSFVDFSSVGQSENIEAVFLNSTLLSIENGILRVDNCSVSMLSFKKYSFLLNGDEISLTNMKLEQVESTRNVVEIGQCGSFVFNKACAD